MNVHSLDSHLRGLFAAVSALWRDDTFRPYLSDGYAKEHIVTRVEDNMALLPVTRKPIRGCPGVAVNIERRTEGSRNRVRALVFDSLLIPVSALLIPEYIATF
jgi:hypothetical protein